MPKSAVEKSLSSDQNYEAFLVRNLLQTNRIEVFIFSIFGMRTRRELLKSVSSWKLDKSKVFKNAPIVAERNY